MTSRITPLLLLSLLFAATGALYAAPAPSGEVHIRWLDQPVEDLSTYAVPRSAHTAPTQSMMATSARSNGTSDVLLVPYFETDLDDPQGVSTLFAVRNESDRPLTVRILYLTRVGAEAQAQEEITIAPRAVRTVNLRDVAGLQPEADGIARGLVVLGVVGADSISDLLSGDFFVVDPRTDFATGQTLLNTSLDDPGNELCAEWGTRFFNGGSFSGRSDFRFVVDVPGGSAEFDPPTAIGTIYNEAGTAVRSFELRTDLHSFSLASADLAPANIAAGSLTVRFPETEGAILVEHRGFERLSVAFKSACRD